MKINANSLNCVVNHLPNLLSTMNEAIVNVHLEDVPKTSSLISWSKEKSIFSKMLKNTGSKILQ